MATHIVAPSGVVKEVLTQVEQVPERKISIIHHGFDIAYFTQVPEARVKVLTEKYKVNSHGPVIGVIARFTELKGIQYIIPAFGRLLHLYPQALLMLFNARGDYEKELRVLLEKLPQANYRLIPFEQDLAAVYHLFDVFIQASTDKAIEAFGQTYVEALASGVPSVFTLAGIAQDFIQDGNNALVVPFKNSDAIYQALLRLLQDRTLYDQLAVDGYRSVVEQFSLNRMLEQLENIYSRR
jgi:glycosyltransferase involved in cell wall biosynthesis